MLKFCWNKVDTNKITKFVHNPGRQWAGISCVINVSYICGYKNEHLYLKIERFCKTILCKVLDGLYSFPV